MPIDLAAIADWLKTSILGIVLLGAIGSLVAVAVLRLLGPLVRALLLRPLRYVQKERLWRYWRSGTAYVHIEHDTTNRLVIFYLVWHLARLVLAVGALSLTIATFAIVVSSQSSVLLTYGTFFLAMLAFLSAYWVWIEYDYITINFIVAWQGTGLVKDIPNLKLKDSENANAASTTGKSLGGKQ